MASIRLARVRKEFQPFGVSKIYSDEELRKENDGAAPCAGNSENEYAQAAAFHIFLPEDEAQKNWSVSYTPEIPLSDWKIVSHAVRVDNLDNVHPGIDLNPNHDPSLRSSIVFSDSGLATIILCAEPNVGGGLAFVRSLRSFARAINLTDIKVREK